MVIHARSWLSMHGRPYSVMVMWVTFIVVGGHRSRVLVLEGGLVVGDDGGVVVVFPRCPGM